ncbi:signal peptidase II [Ferrimonas balearica DSM 9799]|uniref:Lipoprotein signal peptidase n=1 Tax=Ferrimonas balearica (strain DSM 9799 / CCM 4581 / KCTC 23876 / PAT) TaxID=550540 RepID=E1SSF3_FERBD|nr:signal peptidase II [Ferrimonas balearica]MBY6018955.1 signal peptidase II [Halomonas denitrificans]ADN74993.1 signal peptidase II [Ferrimonas balearica DSM 9799]MBW3165225.1 signal peptidase II [Ferrimonas balearica]MBY6096145.1 signal peptidase II [Ferrimonas balearica]MBY6107398.1 signal peptidase II [Ferrimonas balearica]
MLKELWAKRPQSWQASGCKWVWVAVVALVIDQVTKIWASTSLTYMDPVPLMPYLNLFYVHNEGAAFSFLANAGGWQRWGFAVFALAVSAGLLFMLRTQSAGLKRLNLSYALILGGAIGNLIDRVLYGYVIDFIDFYVGNWHWPAFNIADSAICVGAGLMILDAFLQPKHTEEAK